MNIIQNIKLNREYDCKYLDEFHSVCWEWVVGLIKCKCENFAKFETYTYERITPLRIITILVHIYEPQVSSTVPIRKT